MSDHGPFYICACGASTPYIHEAIAHLLEAQEQELLGKPHVQIKLPYPPPNYPMEIAPGQPEPTP